MTHDVFGSKKPRYTEIKTCCETDSIKFLNRYAVKFFYEGSGCVDPILYSGLINYIVVFSWA